MKSPRRRSVEASLIGEALLYIILYLETLHTVFGLPASTTSGRAGAPALLEGEGNAEVSEETSASPTLRVPGSVADRPKVTTFGIQYIWLKVPKKLKSNGLFFSLFGATS